MKYKATQKDRYGNMKSLEITMDNQLEVPPMASAVPMYDHPGEPKGTDTVPAWLTPGEFVVNKEATDMYGPLIKKINDEGRKVQDMKPEYAAEGKEVLDNQKVLATNKNLVQEIFDELNTSVVKLTKVPKIKISSNTYGDFNGTTISKIVRESSYAVNGNGQRLLNENKQPILISGRVDTKKLKEKYPEIWADCLVPTKSVEYKFEIVKSNA